MIVLAFTAAVALGIGAAATLANFVLRLILMGTGAGLLMLP